jgi:exopolysaccharide biosynthesis polyprenyl glycosylphosphotransferase
MSTKPSLHPLGTGQPVADRTLSDKLSVQRRVKSACSLTIAVTADLFSILAGTTAAILFWEIAKGHRFHNEVSLAAKVGLQYFLSFVVFANAYRLYTDAPGLLHIRNTANVIRTSVFSLIAVAVSVYYSKLVVPRAMLTAAWILVTVLLLCQKHIARDILGKLKSVSYTQRLALICGVGSDARRLYSCLSRSNELGISPVAFIGDGESIHKRAIYRHGYKHKESVPIIGTAVTNEMLSDLGITDIFLTHPLPSAEVIAEISAMASERHINISFVGAPHVQEGPASIHILDNLLITSFHGGKATATIYDLSKRAVDVIMASLLILASFPLWIMAAIVVKITSDGPIFFKQTRLGENGKPFEMLKFRSMYVACRKYERSPEDTFDPRITRAGRFLRKTSLDELPQLWNVIRGEMSLVGPRPEMPYVAQGYSALERVRLSVPQGITGIWQLSADRKYAIHESIEYDLYYVENRGFFIDFAILVHTGFFAMKGV